MIQALLIGKEPGAELGYGYVSQPPYEAVVIGSLTLAQLRDMLNTSRKYAQALVEHFDKIHITKKDGDIHYLDQGFQ